MVLAVWLIYLLACELSVVLEVEMFEQNMLKDKCAVFQQMDFRKEHSNALQHKPLDEVPQALVP